VKTYWSPVFTPTKSAEPRVFELRTYTCPDHEKQMALQQRFREHTLKLFEKHGMQNIVYWVLDSDEPEFRQKLIYLLVHKSQDAAKESFAAFLYPSLIFEPAMVLAKKPMNKGDFDDNQQDC
jgi:hypothetical protein